MLISGKTRSSACNLQDVGAHATDFDDTGGQTGATCSHSSISMAVDCPCVLADSCCAAVREAAEAGSRKLHFVPASLTDVVQPLARRVFGTLQSTDHGM